MAQFRIRPESFPDIRTRAMRRSMLILTLSLGAGIAIGIFNEPDWSQALMDMLPLFGMMALLLAFVVFRSLKRLSKNLESYLLTVENGVLVCNNPPAPPVSIPFESITSIQLHVNGSLRVVGASARETIKVPAEIEAQQELVSLLEQVRPISSMTQLPWVERYQWPILLLALGLFSAVLLSEDKRIVAVAASLYLLEMGCLLYLQLRGPRLGLRAQANLLFSFLFLIGVIVMVVSKLS